jgi:hypothetical protein
MKRIDTANFLANLFGAGKHGFQDANAVIGQQATNLNAAMWNTIQEELAGVVEGVGVALDPTGADINQVLQALALAAQVQYWNFCGVAGGTANAVTCNPTNLQSGLVAGLRVTGFLSASNTAAATLKVGALAAKSWLRRDGTPLQPGELVAGQPFEAIYDGVAFRLLANRSVSHVSIYANVGGVQMVSLDGAAFTTVAAGSFAGSPNGVVEYDVIGGGGGGGSTTTNASIGGGGGGGGRAWGVATGVTAAQTITAGAAGATASNGNGGDGGASSFGAIASATGGLGGVGGGFTTGGSSGVGTGGFINSGLGDGGNGNSAAFIPGGDGGGAGGKGNVIVSGSPGRAYGAGGGGVPNSLVSGAGFSGAVTLRY